MAQLKCNECGMVFDGMLTACPNCGCPASDCVVVRETEQHTQSNTNSERSESAFHSAEDGGDSMRKIYRVLQIWLEANYDWFCSVKRFFLWMLICIAVSLIGGLLMQLGLQAVSAIMILIAVISTIISIVCGFLIIFDWFKVLINLFNRLISEGIINKRPITIWH